jgi:hypothetical protein
MKVVVLDVQSVLYFTEEEKCMQVFGRETCGNETTWKTQA